MGLRMGDLLGALSLGDAEWASDLADVGATFRQVPVPGMSPYRPFPPPPAMPGYGASVMPVRRLLPTIPGAPKIGLRLQPLGFPTVIFTATSGVTLSAQTRPQRPFKGKRVVVDLARTGTTATGLIGVTSLNIGTNNQFVSTGAIPASMFAGASFDTNVELAACSTALDITIAFQTSTAPTTTDTIAVQAGLIGESIG